MNLEKKKTCMRTNNIYQLHFELLSNAFCTLPLYKTVL